MVVILWTMSWTWSWMMMWRSQMASLRTGFWDGFNKEKYTNSCIGITFLNDISFSVFQVLQSSLCVNMKLFQPKNSLAFSLPSIFLPRIFFFAASSKASFTHYSACLTLSPLLVVDVLTPVENI